MGIYLYTDKEFGGQSGAFPASQYPTLPQAFSATAQSLKVYPGHAPVMFFDRENFTGTSILLQQPQEISDLWLLSGGWSNRIRSFHFGLLPVPWTAS